MKQHMTELQKENISLQEEKEINIVQHDIKSLK